MGAEDEFRAVAARTREVYERQAEFFDKTRNRRLKMESAWLERVMASIPAGGTVLDLGCGAGEPIARQFIELGYQVTGLDFSSAMLAIVRGRFPDGDWIHADMRDFDLGRSFDAIIGWDSFFHLTPEGQRQAVACIARHLAENGVVLLTVGDEEGEVLGAVGTDPVYHSSFSPDGYRALFADNGIDVVELKVNDMGAGGRNILFARKANPK